ncbi:MAG: SagB/ThcOx family dehydrogenase [Candidatus Bipolaricaulota bacterium]
MDDLRKYLKNPSPKALRSFTSDQRKGVPAPPLAKPVEPGARLVPLIPPVEVSLGTLPLAEAIRRRESRRTFADDALTLEELSFLLWATQGVRKVHPEKTYAMRNVPSGGCRHPFETYLWVRRIDTLSPGLYRYAPLDHALVTVDAPGGRPRASLGKVCYGQAFVDSAAIGFIWTAIPYRTEWRYGPDLLKDILLSCGHICQNLYLACEAIGAGTCAIVAYDQDELDRFIGVDGEEEIALYVAPVGRRVDSEEA